MALLCAVAWLAACSAMPLPAPIRPDPPATPPLWRVDDGEGHALFLFGTLHVARTANGWTFDPRVREAFDAARTLVVEAEPDALARESLEALVLRYARLEQGDELTNHLPPTLAAHLAAHLRERDIDPSTWQRMKPWMAALTLSELAYASEGFDRTGGVERKLLADARGRKDIVSLETVESQYAMMDGLPPEVQVRLLEDTLRRTEATPDYVNALVDAWRRGDDEELARLARDAVAQTPELADFYDTVIFGRNDAMAASLRAQMARMESQPIFAALGVSHLVGPRGVAAQLAARGYRVERLWPAGQDGPPAPDAR